MAGNVKAANSVSASPHRSASPDLGATARAVLSLLVWGLSFACGPRVIGQTITWDLAADWNGRNPINSYWSLSGGPTG